MTALDQRIVLAPTDGSLGPLLRIADDSLPPGAGYGRHEHRDVDVVAVVLAGSLRHSWGEGAHLVAGDVAVLRAGTGLSHDEIAGDDGVRVLQCYLRSGEPGAPPSHAVRRAAAGWVDLRRPDARLWVARVRPGEEVPVPPGLLVLRGIDDVLVERQAGRTVRGPGAVLVWQLDTGRPAWAEA
jgi:redox-sensitive bicupin YhaK (pirin superfamily)